MSASIVTFDFGRVIVDWNPARAVAKLFASEAEARDYLTAINFNAWNRELDRGRTREDALAAAPDERAREVLAAYLDRIDVAHELPVPGTAALIDRLHARRVPLYGLTNGSVAAAEASRRHHPVIAHMRDVVVSAEEGVLKPTQAIYDILIERVGAPAREIAFVDDNAANVEGARVAGLVAHHFTDAEGLEMFLAAEGLL